MPVISVGNLTLGGTGKTPCVEYLARLCREHLNRRPVILSRGYGAHDEALVLEENLPDVPHLQGKDRVELARLAVEELEAEVLILDDGFQHRRLQRDCDIVLLDATRPVQDELMFPRGLLREPVSGLNRAKFAIFTRCDQNATLAEQCEWLQRRWPKMKVATSIHEPKEWLNTAGTQSLNSFNGKPVAAFCGLGNPNAFRSTLTSLGYSPREYRTFPDHHTYTRSDVDELRRWAATQPADVAILTTQKDWVKLRLNDLAGRPLAALRIGLTLTGGEAELIETLKETVGTLPAETDD